jgi:L-lactate dehydrogenase complex protein LldG
MTAREEVLARIRAAIAPATARSEAAAEIPRDYRTTGGHAPGSDFALDRFAERLSDYRAGVHRTTAADLAVTLASTLGGDLSVVVPAGLAAELRAACSSNDRLVRIDGEPGLLTATELDDLAAVVTNCRVGIAETGTIVLDGAPDQGRRALTLVPDHHVVIVFADQVVMSVPESLARLEPTSPLTFISGPSATSDIEFKRVEGVHGPRVLDVLVVTG